MPDEFEHFRILAERIKIAKRKDATTLEIQVSATKIWKEANEELTALNKEMKQLVETMVNNATATEIESKEETK